MQRTEFYGTIDFLAKCGGLLGLCLGVSVISLVEIVYFCTIRVWFDWRRNVRVDHSETVFVEEFRNSRSRVTRYQEVIKGSIVDCMNKTTIHGINYVAISSLTLLERIWWTTVVVISFLSCGYLIGDVLIRYEQSPVIMSYGNEETPISQVIFKEF
jgi:Amiloride-sensitive sodium channel